MKFARIENSIVQEVITVPPGFKFEEMFHSDFRAFCVECPEEVDFEWAYDGKNFSPPSYASENIGSEKGDLQ